MANKSAKKLGTSQRKQWLEILAQGAIKSEAGNYRVLIDTNVWFSGILYGGKPEAVIRFCKQNYHIINSRYLIDELLSLLREHKTPYKWRNALEKLLNRMCVLVESSSLPEISRDPKDDPVIATAMAGNCNYIITGDEDLLILQNYKGISIISVADFLNLAPVKKYSKQ